MKRILKRILKVVLAVFMIVLLGATVIIFWQTRAPSFEPYASLVLPVSENSEGAVRAQFFGTTTVLVSDGTTSLMVDGFFSRPSLTTLLFSQIAPDQARIDNALSRGRVSRLDALLVAHSHADHALDSAVVADKTGALLVGSESTANIARGANFSENRIRTVKNGDTMTVGAFQIVFYETPHSSDAKFPGDIEQPLKPPAKISDYKLGKNYSYLLRHPRGIILIVPSANYVASLFNETKADVVFLGIGGLGKQPDSFTRDYWNEVVKKTGAKLVVPIHWDNFGHSLDEPLQPMPYFMDDMGRSMNLLHELAETDGVLIGFAPLFDSFVLPLNNVSVK